MIPHAAWLACEGERLRYAFPLTMGSIKVRFLLIQWHSCVPYFEHRRDAITKDLEKTHRVLWQFPWVWEAWERKAA